MVAIDTFGGSFKWLAFCLLILLQFGLSIWDICGLIEVLPSWRCLRNFLFWWLDSCQGWWHANIAKVENCYRLWLKLRVVCECLLDWFVILKDSLKGCFVLLFFDEQEILFTRQIELQRWNKSLFLNDKLKTGRAEAYIKRTKNIIHKRPLS